jgi:predicted transcriptional regulator
MERSAICRSLVIIRGVKQRAHNLEGNTMSETGFIAKAGGRVGARFPRESVRRETAHYDDWFHRQVQVGLDSANAGDLLTSKEVEAEAKVWCAEMRLKMTGAAS